jgi:hypothetical protein
MPRRVGAGSDGATPATLSTPASTGERISGALGWKRLLGTLGTLSGFMRLGAAGPEGDWRLIRGIRKPGYVGVPAVAVVGLADHIYGGRVRRSLPVLAVLVLFAASAPAADAHTLSYSKAKRAAQKKGDAVAGKRTRIKSLFRQSRHRYYAQAHWKRVDPDGCKGCGYDPETGTVHDTPTTESCFAEIIVRFRSRQSHRVVAIVDSKSCF